MSRRFGSEPSQGLPTQSRGLPTALLGLGAHIHVTPLWKLPPHTLITPMGSRPRFPTRTQREATKPIPVAKRTTLPQTHTESSGSLMSQACGEVCGPCFAQPHFGQWSLFLRQRIEAIGTALTLVHAGAFGAGNAQLHNGYGGPLFAQALRKTTGPIFTRQRIGSYRKILPKALRSLIRTQFLSR